MVVAIIATTGTSSLVNASVIYDEILSYDASYDYLNDDSSGSWFKSDGSAKGKTGTIVEGDVIRGVIRFFNANASGTGDISTDPYSSGGVNTYLYGIYSLQVKTGGITQTNSTLEFEAATGANALSTLTSGFNWARADTRTRLSGTAGMMLIESTSVDLFGSGNSVDSTFSVFNNASTSVVATAGFIGDDTYKLGGVDSVDVTDLDAFYSAGGPVEFAFNATASILTDAAEDPVGYQAMAGTGLALNTSGDILVQGNITNSTPFSNQFDFKDNADIYLNVSVPEPSTMAIWAALGLGGCGFVARRRMKAKKA